MFIASPSCNLVDRHLTPHPEDLIVVQEPIVAPLIVSLIDARQPFSACREQPELKNWDTV